jgi:cytoskeletal protein CcmA (bactofilin family)
VRAQKVHLATGCKVIADISHGSLMIDEGASFEGQCRRAVDDERSGGLDLGEPRA